MTNPRIGAVGVAVNSVVRKREGTSGSSVYVENIGIGGKTLSSVVTEL